MNFSTILVTEVPDYVTPTKMLSIPTLFLLYKFSQGLLSDYASFVYVNKQPQKKFAEYFEKVYQLSSVESAELVDSLRNGTHISNASCSNVVSRLWRSSSELLRDGIVYALYGKLQEAEPSPSLNTVYYAEQILNELMECEAFKQIGKQHFGVTDYNTDWAIDFANRLKVMGYFVKANRDNKYMLEALTNLDYWVGEQQSYLQRYKTLSHTERNSYLEKLGLAG